VLGEVAALTPHEARRRGDRLIGAAVSQLWLLTRKEALSRPGLTDA
jgi:hypothetical protein